MSAATSSLEVDDRANELYWGSDRSVNQIAEQLDLSKGALYGVIRPLAAGMGCPLCRAEVVHTNRTARDRRMVHCPACEWDGLESETVAAHASSAAPLDEAAPPGSRPQEAPHGVGSGDLRHALLGGAMLGAAVGLALVLWARRR